jgi:hypothetical protein
MDILHNPLNILYDPLNLGNAPAALAAWLLDRNYPQCHRELIVDHVQCFGTLANLVEIELLASEDYAAAEQIFIEALPSVPQTAREWCDPSEWAPGAVDPAPIRGGAPAPTPEEVKAWYAQHTSFGDWLESQGGPRD